MTANTNQLVEEDYEPMKFFDEILWEVMSPKIKDYLFNNYHDMLLHLEPEQYAELEELIRDSFGRADGIIDSLYNHRTITDSDEYDKALDNFIPDNKPVQWPVTEHWFFRQFVKEDDEPNELADLHPFEMDEEAKRVQEIIEIGDKIANDAQTFADFIKQGYLHFNPLMHRYLEEDASFDLAVSSPEGIVACQESIDFLLVPLLEHLHALFFL